MWQFVIQKTCDNFTICSSSVASSLSQLPIKSARIVYTQIVVLKRPSLKNISTENIRNEKVKMMLIRHLRIPTNNMSSHSVICHVSNVQVKSHMWYSINNIFYSSVALVEGNGVTLQHMHNLILFKFSLKSSFNSIISFRPSSVSSLRFSYCDFDRNRIHHSLI